MNTAGLIVAIFISVFFIGNAVLACVGPIGDVDAGGIETDGFDIGDFFSFKGFLHFMFGFSWCWAVWGLNELKYVLIAVGVGILCVILLAFIYRWLFKLESKENKREDLKNLIGRVGEIYTPLDIDSDIKKYIITIMYDGSVEQFTVNSGKLFNTGDKCVVTEVVDTYITIDNKIDKK
jgi:membrane protein implicated in regulation of membrane protease activity